MGLVNGVTMPSACQGSTFPLEKKVFDVEMLLPPNASSLHAQKIDNIRGVKTKGSKKKGPYIHWVSGVNATPKASLQVFKK